MQISRIIAGAVLALLCAVPLALAAEVAPEAAEIRALLDQIAVLQKQLAELQARAAAQETAARGSSCLILRRSLYFGMRGDDVRALQRFLIGEGDLLDGNATGYFGPLTREAVRLWQRAHGIVSSGDEASTGDGRVGPLTRAAIARRCNVDTDAEGAGAERAQASGAPSPLYVYVDAASLAEEDSSGGDSIIAPPIFSGQSGGGTESGRCVSATRPTASCTSGWREIRNANGCVRWYCATDTSGGASQTGGAQLSGDGTSVAQSQGSDVSAGGSSGSAVTASAECTGARGRYMNGSIVDQETIVGGIASGSSLVPRYTCQSGAWVCTSYCAVDTAGKTYTYDPAVPGSLEEITAPSTVYVITNGTAQAACKTPWGSILFDGQSGSGNFCPCQSGSTSGFCSGSCTVGTLTCQDGALRQLATGQNTAGSGFTGGSGNPFGSSSGSARVGAACVLEGQQEFIACPFMANCMGGGTYLVCRNNVWTVM